MRNLRLTFDCTYILTVVKSKGKISQNFVAFSEYMNFQRTNNYEKLYFVPKRAKKLLSLVQEPQQFNVCQTLQEMFQNCMFFKELQPGYLQDWILNIPPFYNPYFQHSLLWCDFTGVWSTFKHNSKKLSQIKIWNKFNF